MLVIKRDATDAQVRLLVFLQDPFFAETLVTDLADVGLVPGVGAFVAPLVAAAVEPLVAVLALVGLLAGMDALVFVQQMSHLERLVAHRTWEGVCSCVFIKKEKKNHTMSLSLLV